MEDIDMSVLHETMRADQEKAKEPMHHPDSFDEYTDSPPPTAKATDEANAWLKERFPDVYREIGTVVTPLVGGFVIGQDSLTDFPGEPLDDKTIQSWDEACKLAVERFVQE